MYLRTIFNTALFYFRHKTSRRSPFPRALKEIAIFITCCISHEVCTILLLLHVVKLLFPWMRSAIRIFSVCFVRSFWSRVLMYKLCVCENEKGCCWKQLEGSLNWWYFYDVVNFKRFFGQRDVLCLFCSYTYYLLEIAPLTNRNPFKRGLKRGVFIKYTGCLTSATLFCSLLVTCSGGAWQF